MGGPEGSVSVLTIDVRPVSIRGLRLIIDEQPGLHLAGVLDSVAQLDGVSPDVVLLELVLRDGSRPRDNIAALQRLGLRVLVYTGVYDARLLAEAVDAGISGMVLKHESEEELLDAIRAVHAGECVISPETRRLLESETARPRLSAREVEVLNLLYQGLITKQAARRLGVSESTVKEHLKRIRQKYAALGRRVSTRVQLLQVAERDGFIETAGPLDPH